MAPISDTFPMPHAGMPAMDAPSNGPAGPLPATPVDLMQRAVRGAHETIDRLAESAAPQVQRLGDGMASASDALHAQAGRLRETRDQWAEGLRGTVRENPLATIAVALAIGALIARVTR
ncbi:MAG: hypothetical protein KGI90_01025 [Burkholderiales bacterium]|nr:hypothetical protein [Burkholderiales bacterium]